jgi:uncharacterized protein YkwD
MTTRRKQRVSGASLSRDRYFSSALTSLLNGERASRGLPELAWNDCLASLAADWSSQMAQEGVLSHRDLELIRSTWAPLSAMISLGENVYWGSGGWTATARSAHVALMRSAPHRVNLLHPHFDCVGIGTRVDDRGQLLVTQNFGATLRRPPAHRQLGAGAWVIRRLEQLSEGFR